MSTHNQDIITENKKSVVQVDTDELNEINYLKNKLDNLEQQEVILLNQINDNMDEINKLLIIIKNLKSKK